MVLCWILAILAALILLLCRISVGAQTAFSPEAVTLDLKIGPFRLHMLPVKKRPEKAVKKQNPPKAEKQTGEKQAGKKELPKITLADIQDVVRTLAPPLKRALARTRRGIRIKPLTLSVIVGAADDPAAGAELYGYLQCGVWTAMPVLEQLLVIPDPRIHIGLDFDRSQTQVEGRAGVSIRVGTLLAVALGVGFPALKWFLRFQKKRQQAQESEPPAGTPSGQRKDDTAA